MSNYRKEFPDYPEADMPAIPAGFEDTSWHNDVCPTIGSDSLRLSIFIDYADVAQRELGADTDRFIVLQLDADGCYTGEQPLVATDDWNEVLAFIAISEAATLPTINDAMAAVHRFFKTEPDGTYQDDLWDGYSAAERLSSIRDWIKNDPSVTKVGG